MIGKPIYIPSNSNDSPYPGPRWDDLKARDDFEFDSSPIVQASESLSINARIAIGVGIYEWIYWYFETYTTRKEPYQILEACWYGLYKPNTLAYIEFSRKEWMGSVHGPLWCGMMFSSAMVDYRSEGESVIDEGLSYLPRLAVHILPNSDEFLNWLSQVMERLESLYLKPKDDLFDNLFEEKPEEIVPREALDIGIDFNPIDTKNYIEKFVRNTDLSNPFIEQ